MPPRRLKKKFVKRLVEKRMAKAIEEYKKSRANLDSTGSSGGNTRNAGGTVNVQGCSHKTFMNRKPHSFNETKGVVGLRRWIEKVKQVFKICKCAEEEKVMFAASTFESRALTWWNRNVHTLGLVNANRIPWTEFKTMITTEYCPTTEIQKMEQELWTLTLKGDDIEAYSNRFHELPATLHDAINMTRELVEQAVQGRAARIGRKLPGPMLQPQLRVEVMLGIYQGATIATLTTMDNALQSVGGAKELLIRRKTAELGFQVQECAGVTPLQDVTCYGCGEKDITRTSV
ncbi:putative reverse transcriptase domain-containing protein [Tanacetum coccineum]